MNFIILYLILSPHYLADSTNDKLENDVENDTENNVFDICKTSTENSIERVDKFSECFR